MSEERKLPEIKEIKFTWPQALEIDLDKIRAGKLKIIEEAYLELLTAKLAGDIFLGDIGLEPNRKMTWPEVEALCRKKFRETELAIKGLALAPDDPKAIIEPLPLPFISLGYVGFREEADALVFTYYFDPDVQREEAIFNPNYDPPQDIDSLISHLFSLWAYYRVAGAFPQAGENCLDLSLAKLIKTAYQVSITLLKENSLYINRTKKQKADAEARAAQWRPLIRDLFLNKITRLRTFNAVALDMERWLREKQERKEIPEDWKIPSLNTIKDYMRQIEEIIKSPFYIEM